MTIVRRKRTSAAVEQKAAPWRDLAGWRPAAALALAVLIFYWIPLTDPKTSIQWDAVDVHYSPQKYFADHAREGVLPFWTPYVFSEIGRASCRERGYVLVGERSCDK